MKTEYKSSSSGNASRFKKTIRIKVKYKRRGGVVVEIEDGGITHTYRPKTGQTLRYTHEVDVTLDREQYLTHRKEISIDE